MNRRRFCMSLGAFATAIGQTTEGRSTPIRLDTNGATLFKRTANAFGTVVQIVVRHPVEKTARVAIAAALDELELIESVMSIYRPDSQLSRLNHQRALRSPHPYLCRILRDAAEVSSTTAGAFDITVQSLWQSYKEASNVGGLPDSHELDRAKKTVSFRNVELVRNRVRLKNGAKVTLNGIAQGFATDQVKRVLLEHGINDALIDVGELAALGTKNGDAQWTAGIQHPRQKDAFVSVAPVGERCLATSGDYATTFTDDYRAHHVFDPRTGGSPNELASVSVLASTATEADALSTAFLVMGLNNSTATITKRKNVEAMFVQKDGRALATAGFPRI